MDLLDAMEDAIDRIEPAARRSVDDDATQAERLEATGGIEQYDRRRSEGYTTAASSPTPSVERSFHP